MGETTLAEPAAKSMAAKAVSLKTCIVRCIWKLVREGNRYVDATQPWALAKDPAKTRELQHVLHGLASVINVIGGLITSTLLTLIVLPVVYTYLDDFGAWCGVWAKRWFGEPEAAPAAVRLPARPCT